MARQAEEPKLSLAESGDKCPLGAPFGTSGSDFCTGKEFCLPLVGSPLARRLVSDGLGDRVRACGLAETSDSESSSSSIADDVAARRAADRVVGGK